MAGYDPIFPTTKGILRKLGGDEKTVKNVVYEKAEVPFYPHEGTISITEIADEQKNVAVFPGMVLTVHYDGADYKCELVKLNEEEELHFGNIPTDNEWNESGMPFLGMVTVGGGLSFITILVNDTAESHIIGISISTETIVPIDPKYLPEMPTTTVIDLDSVNIANPILRLFQSGGGVETVENVHGFWSDVATNGNLRLEQYYGDVTFVIDQSVRTRMNNDPNNITMLSFSFMAAESTDAVYTIHVSIINTFNGGAAVVVKVA